MAENEDVELDEFEAVDNQPEPTPEVEQEVELPEKFKGKSAAELAKLLVSSEEMIGRQAQEVGDSRRLMDDYLRSQINAKPKEKVEEVQEIDFFENPQEAIRQQIESNPRVIAAEQLSANMQKEQNKQKFFGTHPDAMDIVQDPKFRDWVNQSTIRQQLLQRADANFDFDSGNELLGTWKELKAVKVGKDNNIEKEFVDKSIQSVSVDTSGSGESSKKVYKRAKLILLKTKDPAKYETMRDEIEQAYAEGRVR